MAWKRRRSRGPIVVVLLLLLAATVVAPWAWRSLRPGGLHASRETPQIPVEARPVLEQAPQPRPETRLTPPGAIEPAPQLPPLARQPSRTRLAKPRQAHAAIATLGDAAPQDISIAEPSLSAAQNGAAVEAQSALALDDYVVAVDPPPQASAAGASRSILTETHFVGSADNAPTSSTLAANLDAGPALSSPTPLVRVESSDDRLAMLPALSHALTQMLPSPQQLSSNEVIGPVLKHPPTSLAAQLDGLAAMPSAAEWAHDVRQRIDMLAAPTHAADFVPGGVVSELRTLAMRGLNEALDVGDPAAQSAWLRAARALERRLSLWELIADPRLKHEAEHAMLVAPSTPELPMVLHEINAILAAAPAGAAWRQFFEIDELASLSSQWADEQPGLRSAAARRLLDRMADPTLSPQQRSFFAQPPIVALTEHLRAWAAGPLSLDAVAGLVERYETRPTNRDADALAEIRQRMSWSPNDRLNSLADELNSNYRNANLRVAFSSALLNRMIPEQKAIKQRVHDRIAGAQIEGQSQTNAKVSLKLAPEATAWRMILEARGEVKSKTLSQSWPAKLRNNSDLEYQVTKQIVLGRDGLKVDKAQAKADGDMTLVGVDSAFSPVPVIGSLVEMAARDRHRESRGLALREVKNKVTRQAKLRMDKEVDAKLAEFKTKIQSGVLGPMSLLAIDAEPVDMTTTDERAIVRLRMASAGQLGAHTPRPTAPSDSLASVQLHESAINNALRGLGLDGRRMTIGELHALLTEKIERRAHEPPADLPQRAVIQFAKTDAVRVACHEDRVELILNIVEMKKGRDSIKNVGVHAYFRPEIDGLELKLVRDGNLQFEGRQLRTGSRMVLHSVFGKLLRKDQESPVLASRLGDDPRLAGLMITQLVIDDGWVAMSIGPAAPQRTAWRTRAAAPRVVRQPTPIAR